jgi:GDPmannose 4,6-dehydratase
VTRKITRAVARIALGLQDVFYMGNIDSKRDWGHAKDYVKAMWLMLQQEQPDDFVIATGITTTVRDFIKMSFAEVGIELEFEGQGVNEIARITKCSHPDYQLKEGAVVLKIDPRYFRPTEVDLLIGDPTKAREELGWVLDYDLNALVKDMIGSDLELFKRDQFLLKGGHKILNYHE